MKTQKEIFILILPLFAIHTLYREEIKYRQIVFGWLNKHFKLTWTSLF